LLVPEYPVVKGDKFVGDVVRLFDRPNDADRDRLPLPNALQPSANACAADRCPPPVSDRDDEDFWRVFAAFLSIGRKNSHG
jgi:hypothetical protein